MYLLLVTNKGSNILEDLETLRLLGKVRKGERRRERLRFRSFLGPFLNPLSLSPHFLFH